MPQEGKEMPEPTYCDGCKRFSLGNVCPFCDEAARDEDLRRQMFYAGPLCVPFLPVEVPVTKRPSLLKQTWQRSADMMPYAIAGAAIPAVMMSDRPDADPLWTAATFFGPVTIFFLLGMVATYIQTRRK
jgi:hypothetical protein